MNITENTPRAEITIQGATFSAPEPFEQGHQLTENEASAMNQLLHENLRNNFAAKVKTELDAVAGKVDELDMAALQAEFDTYALGYEFGARKSGTRVPKDPIAHQAWKIAGALVRKALKKKGVDIKTLPEGKLEEFIEGAAARADVLAAAKQAVEAMATVGDISLDAA